MIDKIKEAKAEESDKPTDKLKNLLMFFIGVGVIAFVIPEVLAAVADCPNGIEDLFAMPETSFVGGTDNTIQFAFASHSCSTGVVVHDDSNNEYCAEGSAQLNEPVCISGNSPTSITEGSKLKWICKVTNSGSGGSTGEWKCGDGNTESAISKTVSGIFMLLLWVIRIGMIFACLAVAAKMSLIKI